MIDFHWLKSSGKTEIVALLLNRNTEAERFLGGFTDILEHFWAALHQMIFGSICNARTTENRLGELFNIELVSSTRRTVVVKLVLFSYAFRPSVANFFREFYKCGL